MKEKSCYFTNKISYQAGAVTLSTIMGESGAQFVNGTLIWARIIVTKSTDRKPR